MSSGILVRFETNRIVQLQKMARGLKFCIYEVEVFYYICSEIKCNDHLHSYCAADLRLCFRICKIQVFSYHGSDYYLSPCGLSH